MFRSFLQYTAILFGSIFFGCVVIFVFGELYFHMKFTSEFPIDRSSAIYEFHEQRGWQLRPGVFNVYDAATNRVTRIHIRNTRLRSRDLSKSANAGVRRITLLGDSFTFSAVLDEGVRFSDRLESLLGPGHEVLNVSTPGFGTGQEFLLLEEVAASGLDLGEVVLIFFANDIQDNLGLGLSARNRKPTRPRFDLDEDGRLVIDPPARRNRSEYNPTLLDRSYFLNYFVSKVQTFVLNTPVVFWPLEAMGLVPDLPNVPGIIAGWYGPGWELRWKHTERLLVHFISEFRRKHSGTPIRIGYMPSPIQTEPVLQDLIFKNVARDKRYAEFLANKDRPQEVLAEFCGKNDIPFIDITANLRKVRGAYFSPEGHLNELGSEVVADVLYLYLKH